MKGKDTSLSCALLIVGMLTIAVAVGIVPTARAEVDPKSAIVVDHDGRFNLGTSVVASLDAAQVDKSIYTFLKGHGADSVRRVFPDFQPGDTLFTRPSGKVVKLIDLSRIYRVFFSEPIVFDDFKTGYAERDPSAVTAEVVKYAAQAVTPNDPYFPIQNFLDSSLGSDGRISATVAWEETIGDVTQQLGMVDTGIDGDHPEFGGRLAGGQHVGPGSGPWNTDDEVDGGHGTSVAGLMMANTNNSIGVAGVNWNASIWVADMDDNGTIGDGRFNVDSDVLGAAIAAAANAGSNPVNVSFGGPGSGSSDLGSACYNAWISDVSVIASKGNDTTDAYNSPSDYKYVFGVGAVELDGDLAVFSNWGNGVKVVAPGVGDYTTARNDSYRYFSGTSASAPVASGALSLIRAADPTLWADEVEDVMCMTARDLGATGYDDYFGWGCVDAAAAVDYALTHDFFRMGGPHTSLTEVQGIHTHTFFHGWGGTLPSGTYFCKRYAARRYIDYSAYNFTELPDVIIRLRDSEGWSAANPNDEFHWVRVQPGTQTLNGLTLETFAYDLYNVLGQHIGWWPCPHTSCSGGPVTDLQCTIVSAKLPAPVHVSPADGTRSTNGSPTLDWNGVTGAEEYHVQVDNDPNFGSPNREQSGLTATQWTVSPALTNAHWYWRVRAWDDDRGKWGLWSEGWEYEKYTSGGGCPVLYVHNGDGFVKENPLLTACEASGYTEVVTDHYLVTSPAAPVGDRLSFKLQEMAPEVTYLHEFELITVDHAEYTKVACSGDGTICTYEETIAPLSAVDHNGDDRLAELSAVDGNLFTCFGPGHLVVTFPAPEKGRSGYEIKATRKPDIIMDPGGGGGPKLNPNDDHAIAQLMVEFLDADGNWVIQGNIPPRDNPGNEVMFSDGLQNDAEIITMRLSWQTEYSADVINQFVMSDETPVVNRWSVQSYDLALDRSAGEIPSGFSDDEPLVLRRGEEVSFEFAVDQSVGVGVKRDYIVRAVGRYEPEMGASSTPLPGNVQLHDNYPNPFNPTTTIRYDLPVACDVKLEVYNVLGRRVATLVDEAQSVGSHQVTWNGRDQSGNAVASGVYFYRLTTDDYVQSKKMMLLK